MAVGRRSLLMMAGLYNIALRDMIIAACGSFILCSTAPIVQEQCTHSVTEIV